MIHGGGVNFSEGGKQFTEGSNNSRRGQIIHGGG